MLLIELLPRYRTSSAQMILFPQSPAATVEHERRRIPFCIHRLILE
jgi:hypothetical protein